MKLATTLPYVLAGSLLLAGCSGSKAEKPGPAKDGLKTLIKEDIVVGKPTIFNPKQTPTADGDNIYVVYTGKLKNGLMFDTNDPKLKEGARPLTFTLGAHAVVEGWDKGLVGMLPGGVRKLSIPAIMGYGPQEKGKIPAWSDLYFEVKMLDYVKKGEDQVYSIHDDKIGTGAEVKPNSVVSFKYTANEIDGKVLDEQFADKPLTITLGQKQTIATVESGLQGMKVGGIRQIWIPPQIGFIPSERTNVNPNMLITMKIELVSVK